MLDPAAVRRSLNTIKTELEYLRDAGVLQHQQYDSILAQLPQADGSASHYIDPAFTNQGAPPQYGQDKQTGFNYQQQYSNNQPPPLPQRLPQQPQYEQQYQGPMMTPQTTQQAQQMPEANPQHPRHNEFLKKVGSRFGNAVIWGGGATLGGDMINSVWNRL